MASLVERIDRFERELRRLETELHALRREVAAAPAAEATPGAATPAAAPRPAATPAAISASARRGRRRAVHLDLAGLLERLDLLGARGPALAGGAVTAL